MNEPKVVGARVIKWEGDAPKVWKFSRRWPFVYRDIPDPIGHPKCLEVVEFQADRAPVVTYRQE